GYVTVGGEQAFADEKSGARNARPYRGTLVGKTDLIHAIDVADGVAITVERRGRHGLVLLELRDLGCEFVNLLLQVVRRHGLSRPRSVVVHQSGCSQQQHDSQYSLHHLLPVIADRVSVMRSLGVKGRRMAVFEGRTIGRRRRKFLGLGTYFVTYVVIRRFGHECRSGALGTGSKSFAFSLFGARG